ncbi:hypothetical protein C2S52_015264 [Perilla frutescens var. hirtella]|nr:hypothetical protein C2S52_015264 [Perilla frutescens var. hirtella]
MENTPIPNADKENQDVVASRVTQTVVSPGMSEYYVPNCDNSLKPIEGQTFKTLDEGIQFYKLYAGSCGFDIRLGPSTKSRDGMIISRYVYCNREGEKNSSSGSEVVDGLNERHTHSLASDAHKKYLKVNRNLDYVHQKFILDCARANIGPMKSYRLFKEAVGDYSDIGCTSVEYKNYSLDLKAYIIGVDAQMILNKLFLKRESCSAFTFEYAVDQNDQLTRIFWADPIARKNYTMFGDVVSFDATYSTNRYNMIFAPFTGKDNHGKCVTFGAGLLCNEDIESYSWLLSRFKDCMGQAPRMIITDQDPAIKIAVERVLIGTRHRLCMWHIMLKIPDKVPIILRKNEVFTKKFNAIVWSDLIEPLEFEERWGGIINEFGLTDNDWFKSMYAIREYWIPAYFREFSMGGLFRTTSASESVNNFYCRYLSPTSNLVEFFMHFESALDSQRHANEQLNSTDESCAPHLKTPLSIEKHAATIYTTTMFLKVQEDIVSACFVCRVEKITDHESTREYFVDDCNTGMFTVVLNKLDSSLTCSCKKFVMVGLLCSHMFLIMKNLKFTTIPEIYVVSRWTKFAMLKPMFVFDGGVEEQLVAMDQNKLSMNHLISEFYSCVGLVDGNKENMAALLQNIMEFKESLTSAEGVSSPFSMKKKLFDQYYGISIPDVVSVLPPTPVKTKGSGSRLKTRHEKNVEKKSKPLRMCSKCGRKSSHDARNCDRELSTKT